MTKKKDAAESIKLPKSMGRFVVDDLSDDGYKIFWCDDDDIGGALGVYPKNKRKLNLEDPEDADSWRFELACEAVAPLAQGKDQNEFVWLAHSAAKKACAVANRILKTAKPTDQPLPEWAVQALAHGWTPPKAKKGKP